MAFSESTNKSAIGQLRISCPWYYQNSCCQAGRHE